eukprot:Amastigsp_a509286_55.p2 type:complete len:457 gc:universal Amastigsp_a509286_55:882-2252(+)
MRVRAVARDLDCNHDDVENNESVDRIVERFGPHGALERREARLGAVTALHAKLEELELEHVAQGNKLGETKPRCAAREHPPRELDLVVHPARAETLHQLDENAARDEPARRRRRDDTKRVRKELLLALEGAELLVLELRLVLLVNDREGQRGEQIKRHDDVGDKEHHGPRRRRREEVGKHAREVRRRPHDVEGQEPLPERREEKIAPRRLREHDREHNRCHKREEHHQENNVQDARDRPTDVPQCRAHKHRVVRHKVNPQDAGEPELVQEKRKEHVHKRQPQDRKQPDVLKVAQEPGLVAREPPLHHHLPGKSAQRRELEHVCEPARERKDRRLLKEHQREIHRNGKVKAAGYPWRYIKPIPTKRFFVEPFLARATEHRVLDKRRSLQPMELGEHGEPVVGVVVEKARRVLELALAVVIGGKLDDWVKCRPRNECHFCIHVVEQRHLRHGRRRARP